MNVCKQSGGEQNQEEGKENEKKRTRKDRAEKLLKRKDQSETVVKACLLKHTLGDGEFKTQIQEAIQARVGNRRCRHKKSHRREVA